MFGRHKELSRHEASERAKIHRARSLPRPQAFRVAVFFVSVHYLGIVATVTALTVVLLEPSQAASRFFVAGLVFCAISWLVSFFKRRSTFCPLCKGTPLLNTGARTHLRARRLYPLNHGVTAIVSIMATQKFRCMYCGSDYDLLKPSSRLHGIEDDYDERPLPHETRS